MSQQTDRARILQGRQKALGSLKAGKQTRAWRRKDRQKARSNNQKVDADSHGEMNRRKTGTWSQQTDKVRRRKDRQTGRGQTGGLMTVCPSPHG